MIWIWIFIIAICIALCVSMYKYYRRRRRRSGVSKSLGYTLQLALAYVVFVGVSFLGYKAFGDLNTIHNVKEQGRSDIDPKFIVYTECDHAQVGIYRCTNKWVNESMKDTMSVKIVNIK